MHKKYEDYSTKEKVFINIATGILFFGIFIFFWNIFSGESTQEDVVTSSKVYIAAQDFVTERLLSPSTAEYPSSDYKAWQVEDGTWIVTSYVDSQNAFGAMLQSKWVVAMNLVGNDWANKNHWNVRYLNINKEEYVVDDSFFDELVKLGLRKDNSQE